MTIDVTFIDGGRAATEKSNPEFPDGIDVNLIPEGERAIRKQCCRNLAHPAPRCGVYQIACRTCGWRGIITVAGRADDPRTVTIPCKPKGLN